ncbi:LPS assembly protein LptD, partial [Desulfococcaceae bacterium HSG8]|nr:LPS assembly protein LptD [Desulfococcaceae bacterium HSG8]
ETDPLFSQDDQNEPWHISADEIEYDRKTDQYVARGNITITRGDKKLSADFVRFDYKQMKAVAEGSLAMTAGEDILTGNRIEIDLNTETGTISDGTLFLEENHFYIKGNRIEKTGKFTYRADSVSISSCDGDTPAWKITGRDLKVTIEGYAFVKHAALWAKKIPVLYIPFFVFPVKQKRQSGLLIPQAGYSDKNGAEYNQPVYWVISESSDATLYPHYMEKRGLKTGMEYRYVLSDRSKGTLMYDFLDDRQTDADNLEYDDDDVPRPNTDRYWFRMKHDQAMPLDFSAALDIDIVSDQDYLHEFKDGHTGFDKTTAYYNKNFGRAFDDYSDPVRVSRLNLKKTWSAYSLNAEARWYDHVIERRQGDTESSLHKLPAISFRSSKQEISKTPFYWKLDSEYIYFYRKDGTGGHRADVYSKLYMPHRFKNYFTFEPSLGVRETFWYLDETDPSEQKRDFGRRMYDINLELHSNLFKVYKKIPGDYSIKHTITPRITYKYIPDRNQDKYPDFDESDRIGKKNLITASITNTFTARSENQQETSYNRLCRFRLEQSYDISEADETDPARWKNPEEKRPFSPIYGEIGLTPGSWLSLHADAEWCIYENEFQSRNIALNLWDSGGDRLFAEHRYTKYLNESVYADLLINLSDRVSVRADYERDIREDKEIKKSLGILYNAPCWSVDFHHTDEDDDRRYGVMINLYGLGGIGSK